MLMPLPISVCECKVSPVAAKFNGPHDKGDYMNRFSILNFALMAVFTNAAHGQIAGTCSNATLQGSYGQTITGTGRVVNPPANSIFVAGAIQQVVGIAIQTFDGKGNFTQFDNVKGLINDIILDRPGRGTYIVNPDCTGSQTVVPPGDVPPNITRFVLVDANVR